MNNAEYWRGRFSILEDNAHKEADQLIRATEEMYMEAQRSVQAEIEQWYSRFAVNNQISLSDARKLLTTGQLDEFKWTVEQYVKAGEKAGVDAAWLKKLENASAKYHVSRLEAVQTGIQQQIEVLYGNQVDDIDDLLKKVAGNGYTQTAYEVQKNLGLGWDITALNQDKLETLISRPWTTDGRTFRDRCWLNKSELVDSVNNKLIQGMLRGDSPEKTISAIQDRFKVSRYKARRLVHTETTYFNSVSTKESYKELGVDKIEIIETLDSHTCEVCAPLDGVVITFSQYEPGVTVPPFHPNCRGTTAPYYDDMDGERAARTAEGKVYYVPANMKFTDWKKTFMDGGSKENLTRVIANAWGFNTIQGEHTAEDDAKNTNPNYRQGRTYQDNCTHCVASYEMRRRGFDIEATPTVTSDPYKYGRWKKIFDGFKTQFTKAARKNKQASEITATMLQWGNGARAEIRLAWDGGSYGHVFAAEVRDGKVIFIDPQCGTSGVSVEGYFDLAKPSSVEFGRLDNLEPNEEYIKDVCKGVKQK